MKDPGRALRVRPSRRRLARSALACALLIAGCAADLDPDRLPGADEARVGSVKTEGGREPDSESVPASPSESVPRPDAEAAEPEGRMRSEAVIPPGLLAEEPADELWVLERPDVRARREGVSAIRFLGEDPVESLVLESVELEASVTGSIASVRLEERFRNPHDVRRDVVYELVLPGDSALDELVLQIGDRRIRAVVKERSRAARLVSIARARDLKASLLRQEADGVYRHIIGGLEPHRRVDVRLRWYQGVRWIEPVGPSGGDGAFVLDLPFGESAGPDGVAARVHVEVAGAGSVGATDGWTRSAVEAGRLVAQFEGSAASAPHRLFWTRDDVTDAVVSVGTGPDAAYIDILLPSESGASKLSVLGEGLSFREAPVTVTDARESFVRVRGRLDRLDRSARITLLVEARDRSETRLELDLADAVDAEGVAALWARARIGELETRAESDEGAAAELLRLALQHGIVSSRTSLALVDVLDR